LAANAKLPESRCQKSISKTVAIMSSALGKAEYIQIDNLMCFQQRYFAIIYEIKEARQGKQGENKSKVKNIQSFDF
jgi:nucleoid DNA-binding protein